MVEYKIKPVKSIINIMKYPDSWFWARYTTNPYSGCQFSCVYCDARSERYYLHKDFEETVYVKVNAAELLEKKFKSIPSTKRDVIAMAGVCDAYQPAEETFEITRKMLEKILKYQYPLNISTKSDLVLRDLDLLARIAQKSWVSLAFTITSTRRDIVDFLEPNAASFHERIELLRKISTNFPEIQVGVNFMPIVPLLEDSPEDIESVIKEAKKAGAKYIHCSPGMTLRDSQQVFFLAKLRQYWDERGEKSKFREFKDLISSSERYSAYINRMNQILIENCRKYRIPMRSKRWIPNDYRRSNYLAAEKLLNLAYFNQIAGKPYKKLQWTGLELQNLPDSLGNMHSQGRLGNYIKIDREIWEILAPFVKKPTNLDAFM